MNTDEMKNLRGKLGDIHTTTDIALEELEDILQAKKPAETAFQGAARVVLSKIYQGQRLDKKNWELMVEDFPASIPALRTFRKAALDEAIQALDEMGWSGAPHRIIKALKKKD